MPHSCPYCGDTFSRKFNMSRHIKSKHGHNGAITKDIFKDDHIDDTDNDDETEYDDSDEEDFNSWDFFKNKALEILTENEMFEVRSEVKDIDIKDDDQDTDDNEADDSEDDMTDSVVLDTNKISSPLNPLNPSVVEKWTVNQNINQEKEEVSEGSSDEEDEEIQGQESDDDSDDKDQDFSKNRETKICELVAKYYVTTLRLQENLKRDKYHNKIMATKRRLQTTENFSETEALLVAVKQRKHMICKAIGLDIYGGDAMMDTSLFD